MKKQLFHTCVAFFLLSCANNPKQGSQHTETPYTYQDTAITNVKQYSKSENIHPQDTIIDAAYTWEEAIQGSEAPDEIIIQLELIDVIYKSSDGKIHKGQLLTNRKISGDLKQLFEFMLANDFVIEKVIPIVQYNWNDSLSMDDNNSYSFCYRDILYSKHATGMAVDINPRFNPLRWKTEKRPNQPEGALLDTTVNGTLYPGHPVVEQFQKQGFRWGHTFTKYYDDHHFEKR